jgi:hypothetical protein
MGSTNGLNPTQSGAGFLSFNSLPPRLWITSEDEEFDETSVQHWKDEGTYAHARRSKEVLIFEQATT